MAENDNHNTNQSIDRRKFISNTIKLAVLGSMLIPMEQACKSKTTKKETFTGNTKDKTKTSSGKKSRHKWNMEKLVMNSKTRVIHLPTSSVYVFYDEIAQKNIEVLNSNNWENSLNGNARLNKDKSGNILEILALKKLGNDVNDNSLSIAIDTLAKAFSKECENSKGINSNTTNYRLHELMLQLIALNSNIPAENKWHAFNDKVKKPPKLGKRCKWMETETAFNERVKYIHDREADYKKRLSERASKHAFT